MQGAQLLVGRLEAGPAVRLLDLDQGDAPLAGVPVGEVGEEQRAAPAQVERLDVLALQARQRRRADVLEHALEGGAQVLGQLGGRRALMSVICDLSDADEVEAMVSAVVDRLGPVEILIINAGVIAVGPDSST